MTIKPAVCQSVNQFSSLQGDCRIACIGSFVRLKYFSSEEMLCRIGCVCIELNLKNQAVQVDNGNQHAASLSISSITLDLAI
ncbi:MAG: hypothetical protein P8X85_11600 [Desulfobacterales bacterium]